MLDNGRDDSRRTIGRRGHHLPARGIFLVHRHRINIQPVEELLPLIGSAIIIELFPKRRSAALHLQLSGQKSVLGKPALNAAAHHVGNPIEGSDRLSSGSQHIFIGKDKLLNCKISLFAHLNQLSCRREGVRDADLRGNKIVFYRPLQLSLRGNESAAGRKPGLVEQHAALFIMGRQAHPVRMKGRDNVVGHDDVSRRVEADGHAPCQFQTQSFANAGNGQFCLIRIECFRCEACQSKHDRLWTRMPFTCQGKRSLQLDLNTTHAVKGTGLLERINKARGNANWPNSVRTRRADPHAKKVEN